MAKQLINREIRYTYCLAVMNGGKYERGVVIVVVVVSIMSVVINILIAELSLFCTIIDISIKIIVII